MANIAHYRQKLQDRGISDLIAGRLRWWKQRFQMDNWLVGRLVELTGNKVNIDGIRLSVDNPLIPTHQKSTLYFGIYEGAERSFATKYLDRSLPTVEIGGSIGAVSCTVNNLLDDPTQHVVVECSPGLLPTLKNNRDINRCLFTIEPYALAYGKDTVSFGTHDFIGGSVFRTSSAQVSVPTITLRKLLDRSQFKIINLISDCEGAEVDLIDNEPDVMRDNVKWFIVELHPDYVGTERVAKMAADLGRIGFIERERSRGNVVAFENSVL